MRLTDFLAYTNRLSEVIRDRNRQLVWLASFSVACLPVTALAQIALVHVTPCGPQNFPSSCTIPATGAGNLIVVGFQAGGGVSTALTLSTVADNSGNLYAEAGAARAINTANGSVADIWYARNSKSGTTVLTITPSSAMTNGGAVIWEFSGADPAAPLDQAAVLNTQASTATPSGAAVTTSVANEIVVSIAGVSGDITGIAAGSAFVSDAGLKGNGWAHLIAASPGTARAQWTQNPAGTYTASTASFKPGVAQAPTSCDLNSDGAVNVIDLQLITNMNLGLQPCTVNVAGAACSAQAVQQIRDAALTGVCPVGPVTPASHTATLTWTASTTTGVNYNVYRATATGGPYTKLTASPIAATTYLDTTVLAGQTYFYVTTAVDKTTSAESTKSNEAPATVPSP
jgi:hypothetical protein